MVRLACDNTTVVDAINKCSIKGQTVRPLQSILLITAIFDIALFAFWIPSEENIVAVHASRHDYTKLTDLGLQISQRKPFQDIDLAPEVKYLLYHSFAPATRRSYNSARESYKSFCRNYSYIPFPTSLKTITHWLANVMTTAKSATARSYLTTLRSFHLECGYSNATFDDPRVDLIIRGGKRVYGEGVKRLRFPLTAPILLRMVNEIRLDEEGINIKSALCLAFAVFLRSGEFTWDT